MRCSMFASRHNAFLCCRAWLASATQPSALSPALIRATTRTNKSVRFASSTPTIFAPSTAPGKAAISIVRVTGPNALEAWHRMTGPPRRAASAPSQLPNTGSPAPRRRPVLRTILHCRTRELLDEALVVYFPRMGALAAPSWSSALDSFLRLTQPHLLSHPNIC
jgi:GTP-binding protein TrmE N-terminus